MEEIDGAGVRQSGAVAAEPLGDAGGVGDGLLDQLRRGEPEPDGGEGLNVGGHGVRVALSPDLDVLLEQVPHARLLEDPQPAGRAELVADPEAEAVERADVEGPGPVDVRATPGELAGRLVVVGQRGDHARVHTAVAEQMPQALGQDPGLARSGRGDDPGRPAVMVHGFHLVRGEIGRRRPVTGRSQGARLGVPTVDDAETGRELRRLGWAAVDEQRGAVAEDDVGGRSLVSGVAFTDPFSGETAGRLATMPPDGSAGAGVVVVGPDQELQALAAELEVGHKLVDGPVSPLRCSQLRRVRSQLDHHGAAGRPVAVELLDDRPRTAE